VPVYVSNEEYRGDGAAPPEERKAYTQIYHEAIQQKRSNGTVCVYLVAPDGKGFDSMVVSRAAEPGQLEKMLDAAVGRFQIKGGKPLIKPTPQASPPKADKNDLVLHLVARYDNRGSWAEFPAENYIVLKQKDWEKLRPPEDVKPGATWDIDKDVAIQFLTYFFPQTEMCDCALATRADGPYKHKVEQLALRAKLLPPEGKSARIRLDGTVKLKHKFYPGKDDSSREANSTVIGIVEFDGEGKKPSLRLITEQAVYGDLKFSVALRSLR
jgi:hypothetical protein